MGLSMEHPARGQRSPPLPRDIHLELQSDPAAALEEQYLEDVHPRL